MKLKHCEGKVPWGKTCKGLGLGLPTITLTAVFAMAIDGHYHRQLDERLKHATDTIAGNQQDTCPATAAGEDRISNRQLTQSLVSRTIKSQQPAHAPFYTAYARMVSGLTGYHDARADYVSKVEQFAAAGIGACFDKTRTPGAVADAHTIYLDPDARYEYVDSAFQSGLNAFDTGRFSADAGRHKPQTEKARHKTDAGTETTTRRFAPKHTTTPIYYAPPLTRWR